MTKADRENQKEMAHKITVEREKLGLTQSQLARKAKVSLSLVSRIESGKANPPVLDLCRIAKVLDLALELP